MEYEIIGGSLPVVICHLKKGETLLSDAGGMSWMDPCMEMETTSNGGFGKALGRMFSGESISVPYIQDDVLRQPQLPAGAVMLQAPGDPSCRLYAYKGYWYVPFPHSRRRRSCDPEAPSE